MIEVKEREAKLRKRGGGLPRETMRETACVQKNKQQNTCLDVGNVVGSDLDVYDATGLFAHYRAAILQASNLAVVTDEALDFTRECGPSRRAECGIVAHQAAPRLDGGVVVLLRERGIEQRADGGVARGGGRHGRRDTHELFRADKEGQRVVLGDDELDVGGGRDERGRKGHEGGGGEDEGGELHRVTK